MNVGNINKRVVVNVHKSSFKVSTAFCSILNKLYSLHQIQ